MIAVLAVEIPACRVFPRAFDADAFCARSERHSGVEVRALQEIVDQVGAARPDTSISTITRRADPQAPVSLTLASGAVVLADPYSGRIIGDAPTGLRRFFRGATEWHRNLAGQGGRFARAIRS